MLKAFTKTKKNTKAGFTLFIAVVVASSVLLMSFAIADIVWKELQLTFSEKDSQLAFYASDSGVECALYWDVKNPGGTVFSTTTAGNYSANITCNGTLQALDASHQVIGTQGADLGSGTTTFTINYGATETAPCATVTINKRYLGDLIKTRVESRGYNVCDATSARRLERAIRVNY